MSLWMVRGGRHGEQETVALQKGLVCIGFDEVPDLRQAKTQSSVTELARACYPDAPEKRLRIYASQLDMFANRMQIGDLLAMPLGSRTGIALGRVKGPYQYRNDLGSETHHARAADWIRPAVQRTAFGQDLLYSLGAIMTVCQIDRNDAESRVHAILEGKSDPGFGDEGPGPVEPVEQEIDIEQLARDRILAHLEQHFKGHALAALVNAILETQGYKTYLSPPGPDGGADILAGLGPFGFDGARLCVQVKSSSSPVDVQVLRALQGTMSTLKAEQGLLVAWGGFTKPVEQEARLNYFSIRLWDQDDVLDALLTDYSRLPEEIQSEIPLKEIWTIVLEE